MHLTSIQWALIVSPFALLLLIYFMGSLSNDRKIISSTVVTQPAVIEAGQFYYLPTAGLDIVAKAEFLVFKDAAGAIVDTRLLQITLTITVKGVPDTTKLCSVSYHGASFWSDTITLNVTEAGLLQGVNLTVEDRLAGIVDQLSSAPQIILSGAQDNREAVAPAAPNMENITVEKKEQQASFFVSPEQIRGETVTIPWQIRIEGLQTKLQEINASFIIAFTRSGTAEVAGVSSATVDGIFARPLTTLKLKVTPINGAINTSQEYTVIIPDESSLIKVPLKRTPFVKKNDVVKMSNGILTETNWVKPSEFEGFIGIPIKIGKAIVSIPARLLSFKIENIKRDTTLLTTQEELTKAELAGAKMELQKESELLKTKVEAQKAILASESDFANFKLETQKSFLAAQKDLLDAQQALIKAKTDLEKLQKPAV